MIAVEQGVDAVEAGHETQRLLHGVDDGLLTREGVESVEGLVHLSELSEYRVRHPEEVVTLGEEVTVKVIGVNRKRRTVDLSITQAVLPDLPAPSSDAAAEQAE